MEIGVGSLGVNIFIPKTIVDLDRNVPTKSVGSFIPTLANDNLLIALRHTREYAQVSRQEKIENFMGLPP